MSLFSSLCTLYGEKISSRFDVSECGAPWRRPGCGYVSHGSGWTKAGTSRDPVCIRQSRYVPTEQRLSLRDSIVVDERGVQRRRSRTTNPSVLLWPFSPALHHPCPLQRYPGEQKQNAGDQAPQCRWDMGSGRLAHRRIGRCCRMHPRCLRRISGRSSSKTACAM